MFSKYRFNFVKIKLNHIAAKKWNRTFELDAPTRQCLGQHIRTVSIKMQSFRSTPLDASLKGLLTEWRTVYCVQCTCIHYIQGPLLQQRTTSQPKSLPLNPRAESLDRYSIVSVASNLICETLILFMKNLPSSTRIPSWGIHERNPSPWP